MADSKKQFIASLHHAGFRATPKRLALLQLFARMHKPLPLANILTHMDMDESTLYRALHSLMRAHLIIRTPVGWNKEHYALADDHCHQHAIICTECGAVEYFAPATCTALTTQALKQSHLFSSVTGHSVQIFSRCKKCKPVLTARHE